MRPFFLGLLLATAGALADETETPTPQDVSQQTVWERCYGSTAVVPQPWLGGGYYYGSPAPLPVNGGGVSSPPPLSGTSGGSGMGEAMLVAAVAVAVALPVVVYVLDKPAPESVKRRFDCPSFTFDGSGGVALGTRSPNPVGIATGRLRTGFSYFGTDFQFDVTPGAIGSYSFALVFRVPPRKHIEGGIAGGFKRAEYFGQTLNGFEFSLPHEYVLWRDENHERRQLGIELRPGVFLHTRGVDLSVDLGLKIPIVDFLSARITGRAASFDGQLLFGVTSGLSFNL